MATPLHTTLEQELNALLKGRELRVPRDAASSCCRAVAPSCQVRLAPARRGQRPEQGYNSACGAG